jgi:hypothetical protein
MILEETAVSIFRSSPRYTEARGSFKTLVPIYQEHCFPYQKTVTIIFLSNVGVRLTTIKLKTKNMY